MLTIALLASGVIPTQAETHFTVDPDAGNNTFAAVFDAAIGERITAVSSTVGCSIVADEAALAGRATCSVPLGAIRVDNDDAKSDHFRQWATNKRVAAEQCMLTLEVPRLALDAGVEPMKAVPFETEGTFTICGRKRDDGGAEKITGTVLVLPAGADRTLRTLRVRAKVEAFDRERYGVGPKWTEGWLARVQQLATVVATDGTIEVSVFATEHAGRPTP